MAWLLIEARELKRLTAPHFLRRLKCEVAWVLASKQVFSRRSLPVKALACLANPAASEKLELPRLARTPLRFQVNCLRRLMWCCLGHGFLALVEFLWNDWDRLLLLQVAQPDIGPDGVVQFISDQRTRVPSCGSLVSDSPSVSASESQQFWRCKARGGAKCGMEASAYTAFLGTIVFFAMVTRVFPNSTVGTFHAVTFFLRRCFTTEGFLRLVRGFFAPVQRVFCDGKNTE